MLLTPREYLDKPLKPADRRAVVVELMALSPAEREAFLTAVLVVHEREHYYIANWFKVANDVMSDPGAMERILLEGLRIADASTMKEWLAGCAKQVGGARILELLRELAERPDFARGVDKTIYWLRRTIKDVPLEQVLEFTSWHKSIRPATHR